MQAFTIICICSGFLVPISSDRNKRYHASAPHGTIRTLQRYHWGDIITYNQSSHQTSIAILFWMKHE